MEKEFENLTKLIEEKKKENLTPEERSKLNQAESLLKIQGVFFKIDISTALGLLHFIGVPKDQLKDIYGRLTSLEAYKAASPKEYTLATEDEIIRHSK